MRVEGIEFKNRAWQIYEEIWKGFDTYLALLTHRENEVRSDSVTLLCFFGKYSEIVLPYIQKAIEVEQNPDAKQWMIKIFKIRFPNKELQEYL